MADEKGLISPENRGIGQRLAELTPESSEAEIKSAFIAWNREVLGPVFDGVIRILEAAHKPYARTRIIPDQETNNKKIYISEAIEVLKVHRATYCEMADSIAEATTLGQFLALMINTSLPTVYGEWSPVSYGMKDAGINSRCRDEFDAYITFRHEEAIRVAGDYIDSSWQDVFRKQWKKYTKQVSVKSLDNIGTDKKANVEILYGYFNTVLHSLICEIFAMNEDGGANWCQVFEDVQPHREPEHVPDFKTLLNGLIRWRNRVDTYLGSLPKSATRNPNYEAAKQELFKYIDILQPYLLRLQTARKVKGVK